MPKMPFDRFSPSRHFYLLGHLLLLILGFALCLSRWADPEDAWGTVFLAVGASLVAVGIAGCALYLHVRWSQEEERRLGELSRAGIVAIFKGRSVAVREEYDSRLAVASRAIDILGFGLQHLREDHGQNFGKWARRARVRILMIDPDFPSTSGPYADQRDLEEGAEPGQIGQDVRRLVEVCRPLLFQEPERFQIRLYRCLPSINVFRIDDELFWGPYFVDEVSRNMPTFLLERRGFLAGAIMAHFERIWESDDFSRAIPIGWLGEAE